MNNRRWYIALGGLGFVTLLLFLGLVLAQRAWQWAGSIAEDGRERELSAEEIGPAFLRLTGHELPTKVGDLVAIFQGAYDPWIFVRFKTDSEGIRYVVETFTGKRTTFTTLDADRLRAMAQSGDLFPWPAYPYWQRELGVRLIDPESIESARLIRSGPFRGAHYTILIDDQRNTVYIYAYYH